jgi:Fe-Mn family superoxide dismutase
MKNSNHSLEAALGNLIKEKVEESLDKNGVVAATRSKRVTIKESAIPTGNADKLNEALVITPRGFVLKTENLSKHTKESHEALYRKYTDTFNRVSSELDGSNKFSADSFSSLYRAFKLDECTNLNAIKLHELYFGNISDLVSEIGLDSLPYMKLARDYGSFDNWQFDFMACAMSSREGWAITVYEPYKNCYMNVCIDGHGEGVPVGAVPVAVMDMWSHAFFRDYNIDKKAYLVAMMREFNWDVIEARMIVAERSELNTLYKILPTYKDEAQKLLNQAQQPLPSNAPIENLTGL